MLHRSTRIAPIAAPSLLAAGWLFFAPPTAPVAAQASGEARLQGVVVDDQTYQPVETATVSLVGTDIVATTGRWGAFAFPEAPFGRVSVRVSAPGHPSVVQEVDVRRDRIAFVQVVLPTIAATLSELLVRAGRVPDGSIAGARTAADLLASEVPRTRVNTGDVGKNDFQIRLRDGVTMSGNVEPLILIDGVLMSNDEAYDALRSIPASDVREIEVLKGPAAASLYPLAANGVVLVTTKRGR
jgi:TonB-dependent SusC/RagA subfamily outer membrane receptor